MGLRTSIAVKTSSASYTVELGTGLLAEVGPRLDALLQGGLTAGRQQAVVITSPEIWRLWGEPLQSGFPRPLPVLQVPPGEEHKRLATVEQLLEQLATLAADRDTVLLAFGGGVIGDIVGYVAASYMRGIRYVQVPTTALAQIDSSVGGKTGVNLTAGKNLAGAFHHPLAVYADLDVLRSLPAAELRAGLQEAVKAGIIRDLALFEFMEAESAAILALQPEALLRVIADSVRMKAEVVGLDERESGLRMVLNLGHTLGHAIEAATGYKTLLHGEAVAWGMIAATRVGILRRTCTAEEAARMEHVIRAYGPLKHFTASAEQLVALTARDKKNRSGGRSYVVPYGIGLAAVLPDVTEAELLAVASEMMTLVEAAS